MKISASVLASQLTSLSNDVTSYKNIDYLHMDVMDGNFVPQISFGEAIVGEIHKSSTIPLDIHLMVKNPEVHVPKYFAFNPYCITFHYEATDFSVRLAEEIRKSGSKVGISLNPQTPVELLEPILDSIDLILIMTVDPGFYGQKFFSGGLRKIQKAKDLIGSRKIEIEVDGGVNDQTIPSISKAGADLCVVGAYLYKNQDPSSASQHLKSLCS
jgi:ribulose-phosphate 3-epimerase